MNIKARYSDTTFIIDTEDLDKILPYKWVKQKNGYIISNACKKNPLIYLHKFILGVHFRRDLYVDHINRDILDNRKCNLRICTQSENLQNSEGNSTMNGKSTSSKYKGVSFHKGTQKWQAYTHLNNQWIGGGSFKTEIEAAIKANELIKKYHNPEFACLNQIN